MFLTLVEDLNSLLVVMLTIIFSCMLCTCVQLGKYSEARTLSEAASRDDPYGCAARVTHALSAMAPASPATGGVRPPSTASDPVVLAEATASLSAATHLDPTDLIALHDSGSVMILNVYSSHFFARLQNISAFD